MQVVTVLATVLEAASAFPPACSQLLSDRFAICMLQPCMKASHQ